MKSANYLSPLIIALIWGVATNGVLAQATFWEPIKGPYGGRVLSLVVKRSNGYLFAGMLDFSGVFRSTDNGEHWTSGGLNEASEIAALAVHPNGDIFAGTDGRGVYRSINNGFSWVQGSSNLTNMRISSLAINSAGLVFAGTDNGVFRSANVGKDWTPTGLSGMAVEALAISHDGNIFAGTNGRGIFRSMDGGDNWVQVNRGLSDPYFFKLAINTKGIIFAGSGNRVGIFRSADNGETWTQTGLTNVSIAALASDANDNIFAAAASDTVVYRSRDDGATWTPILNGLLYPYRVNAFAFNAKGDVFAGSALDGVFRSSNHGDSWVLMNVGLPNVFDIVSLAFGAAGDIFVGSRTFYGVFRSIDNGKTWKPTDASLRSRSINVLTSINSSSILAGTDSGIFLSTDHGAIWRNKGLPHIYVSALVKNKSGDIFAGTNAGVFRSTNNGQNWIQINTGLTNTYIRCLAINLSGELYAGSDEGIFVSEDNGETWFKNELSGLVSTLAINLREDIFAGVEGRGIFRSTDKGRKWSLVNSALARNFTSLVVNASDDVWAAIFDQGVFRSLDNGKFWSPINVDGFPTHLVYSLAISSQQIIFAGNLRNGLYRSIQSTTLPPRLHSIQDVPHDRGRRVQIRWKASALDTNINALPFYSIWRALPTNPGTVVAEKAINNPKPSARRMAKLNGVDYVWEWVATQPAHRFEFYVYVAETLFDSTAANDGKHYFFVSAHTSNPDVFYDSVPACGFSIDNTPPLAVTEETERNLVKFALHQNYPNPFNPSTTISFAIPRDGTVTLKIYNLVGQEIKTLVNQKMIRGQHQAVWAGRDNANQLVESGIYFYKLTTGEFAQTNKMIVMR